jgi:hypothetical protein
LFNVGSLPARRLVQGVSCTNILLPLAPPSTALTCVHPDWWTSRHRNPSCDSGCSRSLRSCGIDNAGDGHQH